MSERTIPFANGSQYMDWYWHNCDKCLKAWTKEAGFRCEIDKALGEASITDGTISAEIAERMGSDLVIGADGKVEFRYTWDCPERVR